MENASLRADVSFGGGSVSVPAPLRQALGFRSGERLLARVEDERLVIEKPESVESRIRSRFRNLGTASLADELIAERRREGRADVAR